MCSCWCERPSSISWADTTRTCLLRTRKCGLVHSRPRRRVQDHVCPEGEALAQGQGGRWLDAAVYPCTREERLCLDLQAHAAARRSPAASCWPCITSRSGFLPRPAHEALRSSKLLWGTVARIRWMFKRDPKPARVAPNRPRRLDRAVRRLTFARTRIRGARARGHVKNAKQRSWRSLQVTRPAWPRPCGFACTAPATQPEPTGSPEPRSVASLASAHVGTADGGSARFVGHRRLRPRSRWSIRASPCCAPILVRATIDVTATVPLLSASGSSNVNAAAMMSLLVVGLGFGALRARIGSNLSYPPGQTVPWCCF